MIIQVYSAALSVELSNFHEWKKLISQLAEQAMVHIQTELCNTHLRSNSCYYASLRASSSCFIMMRYILHRIKVWWCLRACWCNPQFLKTGSTLFTAKLLIILILLTIRSAVLVNNKECCTCLLKWLKL